MKTVVQRVSEASVTIEGTTKSAIGKGLLVLAGFEDLDNHEDLIWMARKIANLRIFDDDKKVPNLSVLEAGGQILLVSQFTLHASTKKGNRPSYIKAAKPEIAMPLYRTFIELLSQETGTEILTGTFGADMKVRLLNDGPVTIIIDSKNKE